MPCNTRFQSRTKNYPDLFLVSFGPRGKVVLLPQTGHGRSLLNRCQLIIH